MRVAVLIARVLAASFAACAFASAAPAQAKSGELRVLSEGRRAPGLVARGQPWKPEALGIQLRGGAAIAIDELGAGDFLVRARVFVADRRRQGSALVLGESQLVLDAPKQLEWNGPLFASLGKPVAVDFAPNNVATVEVERVGEKLSLRVDSALVAEGRTGLGAVGRFGLVARDGELRFDRFEVRGALVPPAPEDRLAKIEAAIDSGIERGVEWLIDQQQRDGSWGNHQVVYPAGMTGLALYALQRCGVRADHPSIRRGYAYLDSIEPRETYGLSFALLAYGVDPPPERKKRMQQLLERLLSWQRDSGWGYPEALAGTRGFEGVHDKADLSCTQYAALALRACQSAGLDVPKEAWLRCIDAADAFLGPVERLNTTGATKGARQEAAGFRYLVEREPTGSMTAAGICVMKLARNGLADRLPQQPNDKSRRGIELGLAWLGSRFDVNADVGGDKAWHLYFLYGIERVGGLLEIDRIGASAWYEDGAEWLVKRQNGDGSWRAPEAGGDPAHVRQSESDTCFALLFLKRATRAARTVALDELLKAPRQSDADVKLRASGRGPVTVWIEGFAERVVAEHAGAGVRVVAVEYRSGDEVLARVGADADARWDGEPLATSLVFDRPGQRELVAVVHVRKADAGDAGTSVELRSQPIKLRVDGVLRPWMLEVAGERAQNLALATASSGSASSELQAAQPGAAVTDGWQWTRWLCARDDKQPTLTLEFKKAVRASELVLHPACTRYAELGRFDRVRTVQVRVNHDKKALEVQAPADELEPIRVPLGKGVAITKLEVRIAARDKGGAEAGTTGWTEIALYK
ncbi:MAG: hypothetical protein EPO68_15855 [Planctomycetota bacterium]|nr:MAG: hypothetical protein EPO68_15855 [Planctomycetota bacterium]